MGNITSASETINPTNPDRRYAYDALYRLTGVETGATPPSPLEAYTYNKTGDRLSAALNGATPTAYTYAPGTHHLASVGGAARTYDANGNTTSGIGAATFVYNDANRMASMTNGPIISASYDLNGRGERVRKASTISGPLVLQTYTYDESGQLLGEYSGSGVAQAEYIYLDSTPIAVLKGGSLTYLETDHLGASRSAVDIATDITVWQWDLLGSAFGSNPPNEDPDGNGVAYSLSSRFPGQSYDVESNLNYNYFRDYQPGVGRYIESDPEGFGAGMGVYAYVDSSPLNGIDIDGDAPFFPGCNSGGCHKPPSAPFPAPGIPSPRPHNPPAIPLPTAPGLALGPYLIQLCLDKLNSCPPCKTVSGRIVPVDTIAYRPLDTPSRPQHGITGPHYNIYKAQQNPNNCQCFWKPEGAVPPDGLPPDAIPIEPFAN